MGQFRTDESYCSLHTEWSVAFLTRLRTAISEHAEIRYLYRESEGEDNCAKFFSRLTKILEKRETKLGRECHLINELMSLRCESLDDFGVYFSNMTSVC